MFEILFLRTYKKIQKKGYELYFSIVRDKYISDMRHVAT